jgi:acyl carrier protein
MVDKNTVESHIRGFLSKSFGYRGAKPDLDGHADLLAQGILDSTGVLEVVAFLEKELGLTVQDEDLVPEHFGTINRLVAFADAKQSANG